jgi:hypothetical protein
LPVEESVVATDEAVVDLSSACCDWTGPGSMAAVGDTKGLTGSITSVVLVCVTVGLVTGIAEPETLLKY